MVKAQRASDPKKIPEAELNAALSKIAGEERPFATDLKATRELFERLRRKLGGRGLVEIREYFGGWIASIRHSMAEDSWIYSHGDGDTPEQAFAGAVLAFAQEWGFDLGI